MIDIFVENFCNTHAIIVNEEVVGFTTVYEEVDELIDNWCEDNGVDTWNINVVENQNNGLINMRTVIKILENVEKAVKDCYGYIDYDFCPEDNAVSVRVFEYNEYAEYSEDFERYDFNEIINELLDELKTTCNDIAENVEFCVPSEADKKGYGYFNYLEILITPLKEVI